MVDMVSPKLVRGLLVFRWIAAILTTLVVIVALIDTSVLGWEYGWYVLWASSVPSWVVVLAGFWNKLLAVRAALVHDLFLLWGAALVIPTLPNFMGVVMVWYLAFYLVEGAVLIVAARRAPGTVGR